MRSLTQVLAWKAAIHGIDPQGRVTVTSADGSNKYPSDQPVTLDTINGHRDTGHTACPGTFLYDLLPHIRRDAALSAAGGGDVPASTRLSSRRRPRAAQVAGMVDFEATG